MARKTQKRASSASRRTYQPQDLLLAGIGAVSLGRKQIADAYISGFDGVVELTDRTQEVAQAAASSVGQHVVVLQRHAASLRKQLAKQVEGFRKQAQASLAPVLARLGMKSAPQRRKAARPRTAAKRVRRAA